jgi:NADH-quinone oxidoreductase subunit C
MLGVHVEIDRENAEMTSIHTLWAQAWAYQRELREMYGVRFPGSPRLDENFCLEGWDDIPPMRRDFDTAAYSTEHFGHLDRTSEEPRQYMKVQFYPNRGGDEQ